MSFQTSSVLALTFLLFVTATCQVFDVFGSTDAGNPEFNLEIDEVFLTDLENAPVSTHHMRPGNFPALANTAHHIFAIIQGYFDFVIFSLSLVGKTINIRIFIVIPVDKIASVITALV